MTGCGEGAAGVATDGAGLGSLSGTGSELASGASTVRPTAASGAEYCRCLDCGAGLAGATIGVVVAGLGGAGGGAGCSGAAGKSSSVTCIKT